MPGPLPIAVPAEATDLYAAYLRWLTARGAGNKSYLCSARSFLARFPDPQRWVDLPLEERQRTGNTSTQPLLNFLMLHGHLQPGYDYLLDRRLHAVLREAPPSPLGPDLARFLTSAEGLGYTPWPRTAMASQIVARMLIQTGRRLDQLTEDDFVEFTAAIAERESRCGQRLMHYRNCLYGTRAVLYHLGAPAEPPPKKSILARWSWDRHLDGVCPQVRRPMVAYLERLLGTQARSTVQGTASDLAHFGRFLARADPELASLAHLDRQRHIEPYLSEVASALNHRTGRLIAASTAKSRIQNLGGFFDAMTEWGWAEAPARRLIFTRDAPRVPHPLPRYLPPDHDRALVRALEASPHRLEADALLLLRATGLRIGELLDLELDSVHEVPGHGAWLKVPLGKLLTERMVPLDDETLELIDRIVAHRSPGRPLRHPRTGQPVEFLLTRYGRRVSGGSLRDELHRAAAAAGLGPVVPHQLRHTYATALVNAGCSLQALMALLGHVSAEMSLRYGRLFDATVRENYERALALAKERLGPVLPGPTTVAVKGDWRAAPMIKARLAGGYCLRSLAQGPCPYTNICEHCPNFRTGPGFLPVLLTQRTDATALAADAETRGWGEEAARHRRLLKRLDLLIAEAQAG